MYLVIKFIKCFNRLDCDLCDKAILCIYNSDIIYVMLFCYEITIGCSYLYLHKLVTGWLFQSMASLPLLTNICIDYTNGCPCLDNLFVLRYFPKFIKLDHTLRELLSLRNVFNVPICYMYACMFVHIFV